MKQTWKLSTVYDMNCYHYKRFLLYFTDLTDPSVTIAPVIHPPDGRDNKVNIIIGVVVGIVILVPVIVVIFACWVSSWIGGLI